MGMTLTLLRVSNTQLQQYQNDSEILYNTVYNDGSDESDAMIDIDKAWNGLFYIMTGNNIGDNSTHPLTKVLFSEQFVDAEQDMGYGPAHYVSPAQVAELSALLSKTTLEDLIENFDAEKMEAADVYPSIWREEGIFDYLFSYFKEVQEFYAEAAKSNEAVITFIC
jgi:Domain of unknown function (DUF1877)